VDGRTVRAFCVIAAEIEGGSRGTTPQVPLLQRSVRSSGPLSGTIAEPRRASQDGASVGMFDRRVRRAPTRTAADGSLLVITAALFSPNFSHCRTHGATCCDAMEKVREMTVD
jgi:hypothetical protein